MTINVQFYWPDIPPQAFTIMREIAQARQDQAEIEKKAGLLGNADEILHAVDLATLPNASRPVLIRVAAMIVRAIEIRDAINASK